MGVGASLHTHKKVFIFSGDGCFRIYGGNLAEAANLNITLFVFNNMELSLVQHGCESIINDQESYHYHTNVNSVNWESIANGFNWNWAKVNPNLSNLDDIMNLSYNNNPKSLLVEIPINPKEIIGENFRIMNLSQVDA